MAKFNWYLIFFIFIPLFFLSCADKLVEPDDNIVHPLIRNSVKISVSEFVNESPDPKIDIYSRAIPDRIISSLSNVRKVNFPLDYELYGNEDTLVERGRRINKIRSAYMLKRLEDISSSPPDIKVLPSASSPTEMEKFYDSILEKKSRTRALDNYLTYYNEHLPNFPSYLGLSIAVSSRAKNLEVSSGRISLDLKDTFSAREVYEQIASQDMDLLLLGTIKKRRGSSILIKIGLFDKRKESFILRKDFSFTMKDIELNLNKKIEFVSDFIISYLSSFPRGTLLVETEPSDALVFVDNLKFAKTPMKKDLPFGFHHIEVLKEGYGKLSGDVYIHRDKEEKMNFTLSENKGIGKILVSSEPSGGDVYLDLDYKGISPLIIDDVDKGLYKIRVDKEGYKYSNQIIDLKSGDNLQLFFPLEEGSNENVEIETLSRAYNIAKNVFLYSSFVFFAGTIYGFLYEDMYGDRIISNVNNEQLYFEYRDKFYQARDIRNGMLYATIGLAAFAAIFQILELYTEDINVGLTTYRRHRPYDSEDLALYFGFDF